MIPTRANYEQRESIVRTSRTEPYSLFLLNPSAAEVLRTFSAIADMGTVERLNADRRGSDVTFRWTFGIGPNRAGDRRCSQCGGKLRGQSYEECYDCRAKNAEPGFKVMKTCAREVCGRSFVTTNKQRRFCGPYCKRAASREANPEQEMARQRRQNEKRKTERQLRKAA